jgi:hypothetical protein
MPYIKAKAERACASCGKQQSTWYAKPSKPGVPFGRTCADCYRARQKELRQAKKQEAATKQEAPKPTRKPRARKPKVAA